MLCEKGHRKIWRSQEIIRGYYYGNIKLAATVLFSGNHFTNMYKYFHLAGIPWISKTRYYEIQKKIFIWYSKRGVVIRTKFGLLDSDRIMFSGDGRCDSPGLNAKYLTYSLSDQTTQKIMFMSMTQVTEAGNSNRMEKLGLIKALTEAENKNITIQQLTRDRHIQVRKYVREEKPTIDHQFDMWHFEKSVRKRFLAASKKKSCADLSMWIKSIINHLWWCCATCENSELLLKEKWMSLIFHIQNKHEWTGYENFHQCAHPTSSDHEQRKWLDPTSDSFKALQEILFSSKLLSDLKHLTRFSHTGSLEVYHSLYNKWLPKSHHFSYEGMIARSQLAAVDFNLGCGLDQAKKLSGELRYNVSFSKYTSSWTAKPIKEQKNREIFVKKVNRAIEVVRADVRLPVPVVPMLPPNISNVEKPEKDDIVSAHKTRFSSKI